MTYNAAQDQERIGKIVIFRERFLRLLNWGKPLRDQLILELPTLNGLRTTEVCTIQAEHVDLDHGDLEVLDSKKHRFYTIPIDYTVAKHMEEFMIKNNITTGLLFRPGWKAGRRTERPMTDIAIDYIWKKWCQVCSVPYMPPRYGRAYFAADWHIVQGKSLIGLMNVLRHESLLATWKYLSKIYCYEDLKAELHQGRKTPFVSECKRSDSCPVACEGCHCKFFEVSVESSQSGFAVASANLEKRI